MLQSLYMKVKRSISRRGLFGTARHTVRAASHKLWELTPTAKRARSMRETASLEFDRTHNVDTVGLIDLSRLSISSANWQYGSGYLGIGMQVFQEMLKCADIRYQDFLFIDLGSGKGRALFLASDFPFRRILGVEFSQELVDVSRRNIQNYRSESQRCHDISVICEDAANCDFPNEPTVVFLYNPFDHHVMARVVENLTRSLETSPREVVVLYKDPVYGELWDRSHAFRKVKSLRYRNRQRGITSWLFQEMVDSAELYAVWRHSPVKTPAGSTTAN